MNRQWLGTAFFFALLLLILYFAFLILTPFLKAITWAVILAILVYPLYLWLLKLMRWQATREAVIVSTARTPIGRAYKGAFNATPSPTLAAHAIRAAVDALSGATVVKEAARSALV